jgi:hypothetical protein
MWTLVFVSLAVNAGSIHSNVQTLQFPNQPTCEKAASTLDKMTLAAPGLNGKLVTTAKCVQSQ